MTDNTIYIFHMEKGQMIEIPEKFYSSKFSSISTYIEDHHQIPIARQILLKAGGFLVTPEDIISNDEGKEKSNPIYVFTKTYSDDPPLNLPDEFEIKDYGLCNDILNLFKLEFDSRTRSILSEKLSSLMRLFDAIDSSSESLYEEQIMMVNGLQVASANLAEIDTDISARIAVATNELEKFEENIIKWENLFNKFDQIKSNLSQLPLIPQLKEYIKEDTLIGEVSNLYEVFCNLIFSQIQSSHREFSFDLTRNNLSINVSSMSDLRFLHYEKSIINRRRTSSFRLHNEDADDLVNDAESLERLMLESVQILHRDIVYLREGIGSRRRPDSVMIMNSSKIMEEISEISNSPQAEDGADFMKNGLPQFDKQKMNYIRNQINSIRTKIEGFSDITTSRDSPPPMQSSEADEIRYTKLYCDTERMSNHLTEACLDSEKIRELIGNAREMYRQIKDLSPRDKEGMLRVRRYIEKIIENYTEIKRLFNELLNLKKTLAKYIHEGIKSLRNIESDIVKIDKEIQRCLRKMRNITLFGVIFEHMDTSPETYFKCLVEMVRRREFDMKWHIWQNYYNSQAKKIQDSEVTLRKSFICTSNITHPIISNCFKFLFNTRINNTLRKKTGPIINVIKKSRYQGDESLIGNSISQSSPNGKKVLNMNSYKSEPLLNKIPSIDKTASSTITTKKFGCITNEGRTDLSPMKEMDSDNDSLIHNTQELTVNADIEANLSSRPIASFFEDQNITLNSDHQIPNPSNIPSLTRDDLKWLNQRLTNSFSALLNSSTKQALSQANLNETVLSTTSLASSNGYGSVLVKVHQTTTRPKRKRNQSECNTAATAPSSRLSADDSLDLFKKSTTEALEAEGNFEPISPLKQTAISPETSPKTFEPPPDFRNERVETGVQVDSADAIVNADFSIQTESFSIEKSVQTVELSPPLVVKEDLQEADPYTILYNEDNEESHRAVHLHSSLKIPNQEALYSKDEYKIEDNLMQSSFYSTRTYLTDNEFTDYTFKKFDENSQDLKGALHDRLSKIIKVHSSDEEGDPKEALERIITNIEQLLNELQSEKISPQYVNQSISPCSLPSSELTKDECADSSKEQSPTDTFKLQQSFTTPSSCYAGHFKIKFNNFCPKDHIIIVPVFGSTHNSLYFNQMTSSRLIEQSMIESRDSLSSFEDSSQPKVREIWRILSDDGFVYILNKKCYKALNVKQIMRTRSNNSTKKTDADEEVVSFLERRDCFIIAEFVSQERVACQKNNRLGLPTDLVLLRVKAQPIIPLSSPNSARSTPTPKIKTLKECFTQTQPLTNSVHAKELMDYLERKKEDQTFNPITILSLLPANLNITMKFFHSGDVVVFLPILVSSMNNQSQESNKKSNSNEIWRMLSSDGYVYLLDHDDYSILELENLNKILANTKETSGKKLENCGNIPNSQRKYPFTLARYLGKERCILNKNKNSYHLPKGFEFFRVRAQPLI